MDADVWFLGRDRDGDGFLRLDDFESNIALAVSLSRFTNGLFFKLESVRFPSFFPFFLSAPSADCFRFIVLRSSGLICSARFINSAYDNGFG